MSKSMTVTVSPALIAGALGEAHDKAIGLGEGCEHGTVLLGSGVATAEISRRSSVAQIIPAFVVFAQIRPQNRDGMGGPRSFSKNAIYQARAADRAPRRPRKKPLPGRPTWVPMTRPKSAAFRPHGDKPKVRSISSDPMTWATMSVPNRRAAGCDNHVDMQPLGILHRTFGVPGDSEIDGFAPKALT